MSIKLTMTDIPFVWLIGATPRSLSAQRVNYTSVIGSSGMVNESLLTLTEQSVFL